MAKQRKTGVGTIVEIDFTGAGTTYEQVGCVQTLTPPPKTREAVEVPCLEEAEVSSTPGQAEQTDFNFVAVWEVGDTVDDKLDTAFDNADIVNFKISYPYDTVQEETFDGYLTSLAPETIERGSAITRACTARRTTAITRAPATP